MRRADFANPWVRSVDEAPRPWPAWLTALAAAALAVGSILGGQWAAGRILPAAAPFMARLAEPWPTAAAATLFYLCVFAPLLLVPLAVGAIEGRRLWRAGDRPALAAATGLALGAGGLAAVVGIAVATGATTPGQVPPAPLVALTAGLGVTAFQVCAEEVCFRGWLQPTLCARWGPWAGLTAASALFAGLHLIGDRSLLPPLVIANLLLGGLLFGLLALRTGGLWAPVAAHLGWNWTEAGGFGLEPDPGLGPFSALIDLDLTGPALWSGGEAHLNGSLATALVLAGLTGGLLFAPALSRRSGAPGRSGSAPSGTPAA
ncbi:MAG: CPBP family intramembrane metalloprotease [Caulobacteraceae bacterium]|nr:CPBP family intramembrane metalloprotease [Caulobacteraceae bacterium]